MLARATALARDWNTSVQGVLVTLGWITEETYVAAVADQLRLPIARSKHHHLVLAADAPADPIHGQLPVVSVPDGRRMMAILPMAYPPLLLASIVAERWRHGTPVVLATSADLERIVFESHRAVLLDQAVNSLVRCDPDLSATAGAARWQQLVLLTCVAATTAAFLLDWEAATAVSLAALAIPFLFIALLRLLALRELFGRPSPQAKRLRLPDAILPVYSILVPLYDEAEVLPALVRSLSALDYPASRHEVLILLEENDRKTRQAAARLELPRNFKVIVVPHGQPRTKPRALNYALGLVNGSYVVVYDAEDRPEPSQLRDALALFLANGPELACVQARLNTYNPNASFFTRQFTLEYTVLFDAILPALERWCLPLPLGGTSNHFPVALLKRVGGWDPYNVTEDADLGIRLARLGYRTATLPSTTWEEAPVNWRNWFGQRTRWLKGWMQTYLVHMRQPARSARELGLRGFLGLQFLMGAILIAVLAHPLIYLLMGLSLMAGSTGTDLQTPFQQTLGWLALANAGLGLAASMGVAVIAVMRRGRSRLAMHALLMPVYWLLISLAGYKALIELVLRPYHWQKTRHGPNQG